MAQAAIGNTGAGSGLSDQIVVPFHRIGSEIGEPASTSFGRVADGKRAIILGRVKTGLGAAPVYAILAEHRAIAAPPARKGGGIEPCDLEHDFAARRARHAEMEPLEKFGIAVLSDHEARSCAIHRQNFDVAAIKRGVDLDIGG